MAQKGYRQRQGKSKNNNHDILGVSLIVVSLFLLLCIVIPPILSVLSQAIFAIVLGVFGIVAYPALIALFMWGVMLLLRRHPVSMSVKNTVCTVLLVVFGVLLLHLASTHAFLGEDYADYIVDVYDAKYSVGGVIIGTIAYGIKCALTEVGCYVLFSVGIVVTVVIMTNLISRIRSRRVPEKPAPTAAPVAEDGFNARTEPRSVLPVEFAPGLFVGTVEPRTAIVTETGRATDLPASDGHIVSAYRQSPVMEPDEDRSDKLGAKTTAAHTLYGDSDAIKRKFAEEYIKRSEKEREAEASPREPVRDAEIMEPHVRAAADAKANSKPKKIIHDSHDVFFPVEKNLVFNDDGIENADDIKRRLQEDTKKRKQSDIGSGDMRFEPVKPEPKKEPPAATFTPIKRVEPSMLPEPDTPIIDTDSARTFTPAFETPAPVSHESVDDRFLRALADEPKKEPSVAFFEHIGPQNVVQDEIINTDVIRGSAFAAAPEPPEQSDPDDIIMGDVPEAEIPPQNAAGPEFDIAMHAESDGIIDGMDGLVVSDAPAVDMSETHDITSDLLEGDDLSGMYVSADEPPVTAAKPKKKGAGPIDNQISIQALLDQKADESVVMQTGKRRKKYGDYVAPPIDLLKIYNSEEISQESLQHNAELLEAVISDHLKVESKVVNIVPGPTVTRYEVECPMGTPVNQIDTESCIRKIMYELMAVGLPRIEAPIPGKRAVGIEIPNARTSTVGLREVIESNEFKNSKSPMTFAVGKGISGDIFTCDLEKIPHLLIAGQTGSGKSACLNGLIVSLMYKSSPEDLRFILIDPKRVEFSAYADMPHLLFDKILVDPKDVFNALKWAENEMERRYTLLSKMRCNQIASYNRHADVVCGKVDRLPHIIIICDELGNLMLSNEKQGIEEKIKNIAAKARAAGIHLILATQRPSADVITGTIKANLTSQIAFKVGKQIDSRIILDEGGAETLVGKGDMLFFPVDYSSPKRVQGAFIDESEVLAVIDYLRNNVECDFDEEAERSVMGFSGSGGAADAGLNKAMSDPLLADVLALCIRNKQASTSGIQRRFSIGFARASRIMDIMEELKYIGPATGNSKPREVLITHEQYKELFNRDVDDN